MADISSDELQKLIEELQDKFGYTNKTLTDFAKNLKKNGTNVDDALKSLAKQMKKGKDTYEDHIRTLTQLDDALEELTDSAEDAEKRRNILETREAIQKKAIAKGLETAVAESTTGIIQSTGKMAAATIRGVGTFVKGLQDNTNSNQLATGIFNAGIDIAETGISGLGKAASSIAPMLLPLGPIGAAAGVALGVLGAAASTTAPAMAKLAKFGVEVLNKEVEKTIKTFHDATSVGALFAHGMDDLRKYSGMAGITVDQFSSVLKSNSESLAESGYTVSGGAKILANVTSQFAKTTGKSGQTLQREMQNLGYGFQEQADLAAQTIANLRRTGATATNAQMATATADLAKNMRIVADITGQDAKAKMDQAKKQAEQYAFFAKVNDIARRTNDPGLPKRVEASLALLTQSQQTAAIQATVLNGAVSDVTANMLGQADAGREFAATLLKGNASVEQLNRGYAQAGDKMLAGSNDLYNAVSTAAIATGQHAEYANEASAIMLNSYKNNTKNIALADKDAKAASNATGQLQNSVMTAEAAAQNLKIALQDTLTPAIGKFAEVSMAMLTSVQSMLAELGIGTPAKATNKFVAPMPGTGKGILSELGFAKGGIASGPLSGYTEKLHGTEAVVPLPDGKTIPVTMDSSSITNSIQQQNNILNGILEALHKNNQLTSGILQSSY